MSTHSAVRRDRFLRDRKVDLVLDVGAATGMYAMELRRFGYRGDIASFEPLSNSFHILTERSRKDPRWSIYNVALGDGGSAVRMLNVSQNRDSSSILPMLRASLDAAPETVYVRAEPVRLASLDSLWESDFVGFRRPFLKLDVQGYERQVLDGATSTLGRIVGIQIELSLRPLYDGAMVYLEACSRLQQAGFTLVGIIPGFADRATGELLQADGIFVRV